MTHPCLVISIAIERPLDAVARYLAEPRNFPAWASGLADGLTPAPGASANTWVVEGPQGGAQVRFAPPNDFGVADHWVTLPDGGLVYVPLRAVANGDGCEVALTLFRLPDMDDARFADDADNVRRDLAALKRVLEAEGRV